MTELKPVAEVTATPFGAAKTAGEARGAQLKPLEAAGSDSGYVHRAGPGFYAPSDFVAGRANSTIELAEASTAPGGRRSSPRAAQRFTDLIISGVQEQDAEKVEVVETFGLPHVFASGRFMRKYTFAGAVRTAPTNAQSADARTRTPQSVLLRVFYDKYMRATATADTGRMVRIIVDSEVYEGWATTLNIGRESTVEHFADFTFSFVAIDRYNLRLEDSALSLLKRFEGAPRRRPLGQSFAKGELDDAMGATDLDLTPTNKEYGAVSSDSAETLTKPFEQAPVMPMLLVKAGGNTALKVVMTAATVDEVSQLTVMPNYVLLKAREEATGGDGTTLSDTFAKPATPLLLFPVITDFAALKALSSSGDARVRVTWTITPDGPRKADASGQSRLTTFTATFSLVGAATVEVTSIQLTTIASKRYGGGQNLAVAIPAGELVDPPGTDTVRFTLSLGLSYPGTPAKLVPAVDLANLALTIGGPRGPGDPLAGGLTAIVTGGSGVLNAAPPQDDATVKASALSYSQLSVADGVANFEVTGRIVGILGDALLAANAIQITGGIDLRDMVVGGKLAVFKPARPTVSLTLATLRPIVKDLFVAIDEEPSRSDGKAGLVFATIITLRRDATVLLPQTALRSLLQRSTVKLEFADASQRIVLTGAAYRDYTWKPRGTTANPIPAADGSAGILDGAFNAITGAASTLYAAVAGPSPVSFRAVADVDSATVEGSRVRVYVSLYPIGGSTRAELVDLVGTRARGASVAFNAASTIDDPRPYGAPQ